MTTFEEILKACASGKLPRVAGIPDRKFHNLAIGQVTTIKLNRSHRGIAVQFPGMSYDVWFSDSQDTDKRSRYIYELTIAPEEVISA